MVHSTLPLFCCSAWIGTKPSAGAHQNRVCSLNLSLPTGQLHARQEGGNSMTDLQACFTHLIDQLKKHKQALRREEAWHRDRAKGTPSMEPEG